MPIGPAQFVSFSVVVGMHGQAAHTLSTCRGWTLVWNQVKARKKCRSHHLRGAQSSPFSCWVRL